MIRLGDWIPSQAASAASRLAEGLERGYRGPSWHGPTVVEAIAAVSPEEAAAHPVAGAHSIAELVRHVGAWKRLVARWARGEPRGAVEPEADWPPCGGSWEEQRAGLEAAHRELVRVVRGLSEAQLARRVGESDLRTALEGLVHHDLYHAGQIALLRRAVRTPEPL